MSTYTQSILIAFFITIILSFVLFIPWLIYTYRKYSYLSMSKTIIMFSFIFYFLSALCLVLLPFPSTRDTCSLQSPDTVHTNLRLFQFVEDILKDSGVVLSNPSTWLAITKQQAFYQAFFNFLLLMPFGVYLRYFLQERRYWKRAFIISFLLTLFYEITQRTGIYGIFNCAYRIFDVDDLLLNSVGALLGFFLAPIVWALFPSHEEVEAKAAEMEKKDIVKPISILLALVIDLFIVQVILFIIGALTGYSGTFEFLVVIALYMTIFGFIPSIMNGATVGMKIMRFTMVNKKGKSIVRQSWRRCVAIVATVCLLEAISTVGDIQLDMDSPFYVLQIVISLLASLGGFALTMIIAIHVIRVIVSGGKRRLYIDHYADLMATRKK
ncbi:VanZ family protein [Lysinibacillus sp. FSL M8-0216]|uniref:Glycopeptide antibiotics resistance protein n=1 Tax=Lysinibacillus fusiformis TaxID=28031 RepID=A0A1H9PPJ6_9BACI|nr:MULTISPECIES: VanZ family protein [Lysinibacillus]MCG7437333.1 VanZ family protein [Lysinibacillus fusiformis]MED4667870.1 VanZ family protein [Lysinibacillus fusiformis]QAS58235.1 VanZ family protein [Lysinibacillus sphaericus]RDV31694.1 VanZ family protein [Lysinibacillus fusiformis]SCX66253.1 Glycopeptide antibiotics resistance protein [Lysinibacillus fusiformis]